MLLGPKEPVKIVRLHFQNSNAPTPHWLEAERSTVGCALGPIGKIMPTVPLILSQMCIKYCVWST